MLGTVVFAVLMFVLPSFAVKGYLLKKEEIIVHGMMGTREVKEVKEYHFPGGMITESVTVEGMEGIKGKKHTNITLLTDEGMMIYNIDHNNKQYFKMVMPYDVIGSLGAASFAAFLDGIVII